ncbi:hypothetical protein Mic7113_2092 [Allocoleopsis franciscana PCC 7113]|uniref:Uncharacterized protein n=1 Tax=Allocoleopsis franciscana PCC 7113 TaxID=1173027 RepID=K9WDS4_9CYAN|nr:hypothetical protein Mic7113_2092 [Allocoleopsis franciscana PCC 7113]
MTKMRETQSVTLIQIQTTVNLDLDLGWLDVGVLALKLPL